MGGKMSPPWTPELPKPEPAFYLSLEWLLFVLEAFEDNPVFLARILPNLLFTQLPCES